MGAPKTATTDIKLRIVAALAWASGSRDCTIKSAHMTAYSFGYLGGRTRCSGCGEHRIAQHRSAALWRRTDCRVRRGLQRTARVTLRVLCGTHTAYPVGYSKGTCAGMSALSRIIMNDDMAKTVGKIHVGSGVVKSVILATV